MAEQKRYSLEQIRRAGLTTITAYSGCESTAPNSRAYILAALETGAEFIEVDVRYDGERLYLSHDVAEDPARCVMFDTFLQLVCSSPTLFVKCDVASERLLEPIMEAAMRYDVGHRILVVRDHADPRTVDDESSLRLLLKNRIANITTRKPALALRLRDEIQGSPETLGLLPDGSIEKIIREASQIMLTADSTRLSVKQKAGSANFVTECDVKVQKTLEEAFRTLIPRATFLAEEDGEDSNGLGDGYTFVIDPIDGTTNFMLGRRTSAISVALLKAGTPVYGAVFDPYARRYYSATAGQGAYCNHQPIHVSERAPRSGIVAIGTAPYYKETLGDTVIALARALLIRFGDLRRSGSAALDLCAVACGECDAFCEPLLSPWDFAAGSLIVREAGGIITDFDGAVLKLDSASSVLAASPASASAARQAVCES